MLSQILSQSRPVHDMMSLPSTHSTSVSGSSQPLLRHSPEWLIPVVMEVEAEQLL